MPASGRYWVIRHPASGTPKKTVAQFNTSGGTPISEEVAAYPDFKMQEVSGRSSLVDDIDQSGLSESERDLLSQVYSVV